MSNQTITEPTLKEGSSGPEVEEAQSALLARNAAVLVIDGQFGPATTAAVKSYQGARESGTVAPLAVDGIIGPHTWARLDPPTIQNGAQGDAVKLLQELLGAVTIDGLFGPLTEQALKAFQAGSFQVVDGIAGPQTWTALQS